MKPFVLFSLMLIVGVRAYATHLLGGYIQANSTGGSALTYEITVSLYLNQIQGTQAANDLTTLLLCFGDGKTRTVTRQSQIILPNAKGVSLNVYRTTYTYAGPNTYTLTTTLTNRTTARNISNQSTQEPITLMTRLLTHSALNRTPRVTVPGTGFRVSVNKRVVFPLQAIDDDGDSLVFNLIRPLTSLTDVGCNHQAVNSFSFPNDVTRQGIFKLNGRTGELVWNTPTEQGYYSVAFIVTEYRKGILLSETAHEIPLIVTDISGTPDPLPPYEPAFEGAVLTSLSEPGDSDVQLTVFPNPVNDRLQVVIQTSMPSRPTVQLLDMNGSKLHELTFYRVARQHEQVIGMGDLSAGLYVLRIDVDGQYVVQKVVKK